MSRQQMPLSRQKINPMTVVQKSTGAVPKKLAIGIQMIPPTPLKRVRSTSMRGMGYEGDLQR